MRPASVSRLPTSWPGISTEKVSKMNAQKKANECEAVVEKVKWFWNRKQQEVPMSDGRKETAVFERKKYNGQSDHIWLSLCICNNNPTFKKITFFLFFFLFQNHFSFSTTASHSLAFFCAFILLTFSIEIPGQDVGNLETDTGLIRQAACTWKERIIESRIRDSYRYIQRDLP